MSRALLLLAIILLVAWYFWPVNKGTDPENNIRTLAPPQNQHSEIKSSPTIDQEKAEEKPASKKSIESLSFRTFSDDRLGEEKHKMLKAFGLVIDRSHPSLGDAYRDRRGMVWGEIKRLEGATGFNDEASLKVTQFEAEALCVKDGNRLPTVSDYKNFVSDFGASPESGYKLFVSPQEHELLNGMYSRGNRTANGGYSPYYESEMTEVLPSLTFQRVWTSTLVPGEYDKAYVFNGKYGFLGAASRNWKTAFLCIFDPAKETKKKL